MSLLSLGALALLLHLLGVLAAFHAILNTRTSQGAVAWAVSLATMPYLTLIPYLFLGRSHFSGYIDARRVEDQLMRTHAQQRNWFRAQNDVERCAAQLGHQTTRALAKMTGSPLLAGNRVRLLVDGDATFEAIFAAIAGATHYIVVQFFIVRDDALGQRMKHALLERAAQGVRVYLLYDGIGSHDLPRRFVAELRAGGVQTHKFATRRFVNRFQINFRNHRKIVVVDGRMAHVGGHNVGVEYLGAKPPLSPWRDTHIEIEGPVVAQIQLSFAEDWFWATQQVPELGRSEASCAENMCCQVVQSGPADRQETCSLFFVEAVNAARERVWITTPYFVPDEAVFAALRLAAFRGVDVRILIPSRRDHRVVFAASTLYAHDAIEAGIHVFRYRPGFLHQKVMLIDDDAAAVGSPNLDNRSFRLNFELTVLTVDQDFARQVREMLETDFGNAFEIDAGEFKRANAWQRGAMHVARLFGPIL